VESLQNLRQNLLDQGADPAGIPLVIQYNKRDLPGVVPLAQLERVLNPGGAPSFEAAAVGGQGVFETLRSISELVLRSLSERFGAASSSTAGQVPS
jgi:signal recognition particle receptor subunit beta